MTDQDTHAHDNARAHLDTIVEFYDAINTGHDHVMIRDGLELEGISADEAEDRLYTMALSVETRSDWRTPGTQEPDSEYRILITWGGPACQVTGTISEHGEPDSARIQYQDWFTPWTDLYTTEDEDAALLWFASRFIFAY